MNLLPMRLTCFFCFFYLELRRILDVYDTFGKAYTNCIYGQEVARHIIAFIYCILRSHCPIFLKYLPCFHLIQIRPQKFRNELRAAEKAGRIKHYNHTTNVLSLPASSTIYDCVIDGMKFILLSATKHSPRNHKQNRKL